MAEQPQAPVPGQILAPSTLELAWDRNKKSIISSMVLLGVVLLGYYGTRFYRQSVRDKEWLGFSRATDLRKDAINGADFPRSDDRFGDYWRTASLQMLATGLPKSMEELNGEELRKQIESAKGTAQAPYLQWVLANHLRFKGDLAGARTAVEQLMRDYPDHALCKQVAWPPAYVQPPEEPTKEKDANAGKPKVPAQGPSPASVVSLFVNSIEQDKAIRETYRGLFEAPQPDATPVVAIKFKLGDEEKLVRIQLYGKAAPRHVANFIAKVKGGHFNQLNVHQLHRQGTASQSMFARQPTGSWFMLGNPKSKEADREKWMPEEQPKEPLPVEENLLSTMEGMIAAPAAYGAEGRRSNPDIIQFVASDASADSELGTSVTFGRVVEGLDIVKRIAQEPFASQRELEQGRGAPQRLITVVSAVVEKE